MIAAPIRYQNLNKTYNQRLLALKRNRKKSLQVTTRHKSYQAFPDRESHSYQILAASQRHIYESLRLHHLHGPRPVAVRK